jgi:AbrB family looped-hinge helix DNA binding protein
MQTSAVISFKGQLVIPAELRKKYGLQAGMRVLFSEQDGKLTLEPADFDPFLNLRGALKGASLVRRERCPALHRRPARM